MAITNAKKMIKKAFENGYAVGQFNVNNLEWAKTILEMAQQHQSPVILGISGGAAKYMGGYKTVRDMIVALDADMKISVPVAIHMDHGHDEDCQSAVEAGFTSLMFDGSHLSIEENLASTKKWKKIADEKNLSLEAEVGSIGGEEDGIIGTGELASPEHCKAMLELGVDFLAAGIGNIHGPYPKSWKSLSFETLEALRDGTESKMPFVLHGGSGIPEDQITKAISLGVAKINVNTELQLVYSAELKKYFDANKHLEGKGFDPRKVHGAGMEACKKELSAKMSLFGSVNKAK